MQGIFVGRQPIYDRQQNVYAYELLFRNSDQNNAHIQDPDRATSELILNALTDVGLDNIVGDKPGFINLTRNFVTGILPLPGAANHLVLEVLEDIELDAMVLNGIRKLKQQNFVIALDDFIFHPHLQPLVEIADIIKIDLLALDEQQLREHVTRLREFPPKLLAEKVETHEVYAQCIELGFDYFQGYFFARPNIVAGTRIPANRMALLHLLGKISDTRITIDELEQRISKDVSLSFRLLRYINSSQYGMEKKVDSIKHAIMLLGIETVRAITCLIVFSSIDDKPFELFVTALIRARMCELFAAQFGEAQLGANYFTVGLFSAIDAIMDQPIEQVLAKLPLSESVTRAIIHHEGRMGQALQASLAQEQGRWEELDLSSENLIRADDLALIYLEALSWCRNFIESIETLHAA